MEMKFQIGLLEAQLTDQHTSVRASMASLAPVALPWVLEFDEETQQPFWENLDTGDTSWVRDNWPSRIASKSAPPDSRLSFAQEHPSGISLPDHPRYPWKTKFDSSGQQYYLCVLIKRIL